MSVGPYYTNAGGSVLPVSGMFASTGQPGVSARGRGRLDPVAQAILRSTSWAILPAVLDEFDTFFEGVAASVGRDLCAAVEDPSSFFFLFDDPEPADASLDVVDGGVAVISIDGPLFPGVTVDSFFGRETGYATLIDQVGEAAAREDVSGIVLSIDSPGGVAVGPADVFDAVRAASSAKPVVAYAPSMAASAAYWIGAAADSFFIGRSAMVGSIGVRTRFRDWSAYDEKRGIRTVELVSSNAPEKRTTPVDDTVIATAQAELDAIEDIFVADVATGRRTPPNAVRETFGRGGVRFGFDAVGRGMADGVGTFNDAVALAGSRG